MHMKAHQPSFSRQRIDFSVLEHIDQSAIIIPASSLIRNILYFHTFESVRVRNIFSKDSLPVAWRRIDIRGDLWHEP